MSTVVSDEKAATRTAPKDYKQFIGGQWVAASNGSTFADHDPFSGDTMANKAVNTMPTSASCTAMRIAATSKLR